VTVLLSGSMWYEEAKTDETKTRGTLSAGGVEFFRAARGAWHTGGPTGEETIRGFQLWLSLPPELESSAPDSSYLNAADVPSTGPARLILGAYAGLESSIPSTYGINYLTVRLKAGEKWTYATPASHDVAFIAVSHGSIVVQGGGDVVIGELVVFEEAPGVHIAFEAKKDAEFVLGSAVKHAHELIMGRYSVHTSKQALIAGEAEIKRVGTQLKAKGII
jgi:redox-sensitive bicupin YhaK (pirin superfamily)